MMRTFLLSAAALCWVVLAAPAFAQTGEYRIQKISPSAPKSPDYNFNGEKKRVARLENWLEVEVEFNAKTREKFTDELTVKYFVLFEVQPPRVLTGEVTHVNVPSEGRDTLYSVMYVPPRTIARVLEGKPFTTATIANIAAQILIRGAVVAQESWKTAPNPNWFQALPNEPGLLLNKNETPFAPLFWERYEAIKANTR